MTHTDTTSSRTAHRRAHGGTKPRGLARLAAGAVVASTIGLSAGALAPAGIAHAYAGSCVGPVGAGNILQVREFSLQDAGNGNSLATVEAYAAMPQSDAQAYIDRPGKQEAAFRLWGDTGSDLLVALFNPERYWASPAGLGMRGARQVSNAELDSVPGSALTGRKEFYATIRVPEIGNGSTLHVETCRLSLAP
ncbi:hypothetical protein O6P37_07950 [Mycobacterium sp. CPCC 205372]|uniref:Uncharacterized protein n=1 Tax=Mycobacterium hippophais TaxID=3016340 RepID=A0ABT4PQF4_9MYCO|nr:hypothetical protein [Mycobacterium hippophais]MCZ8378787.1 hypothetical protein [Mycobacterium hippophais]